MLTFTPAEIFYLFGTFHGVFLASLLIFSKRSARTNIWLSLLLVLFSFYLLESVIFSSGYIVRLPHFFLATLPVLFLLGPLFYLYIRHSVYIESRLTPGDLIHLVPMMLELAILWNFYALDGDTKVKIYEATINNTQQSGFSIYFLGYLIYVASTSWYCYASYKMLLRVDTKNDPDSQAKRNWLKRSSLVLLSYMVWSLVMSVISNVAPQSVSILFHTNLILQTLLIHAIGYVAFLHPTVLQTPEEPLPKYRSSTLDSSTLDALKIRFVHLLNTQQPYLDSEISPDYFAEKLGLSRHHFSQFLTLGMQTSFYEVINTYRVEEAKKLLLSRDYSNAKILHIAYDCGFSNKSSFLRNFKKHTGSTPTEYRALHLNRVPLS